MPTIEWFDGPRAALADLFALADDAPAKVRAYRDLGRVLVARDGPEVVGHLQLISGERPGETELKEPCCSRGPAASGGRPDAGEARG